MINESEPMTAAPFDQLLDLTARIAAAYLGRSPVALTEIGTVVAVIHRALQDVANPPSPGEALPRGEPAVPIKKSVTDDYLVCLEDGVRVKMLKRRPRTRYNLTPDQYRERWGLPRDYPMVAANYAKQRSALAKGFGLGVRGKVRKAA